MRNIIPWFCLAIFVSWILISFLNKEAKTEETNNKDLIQFVQVDDKWGDGEEIEPVADFEILGQVPYHFINVDTWKPAEVGLRVFVKVKAKEGHHLATVNKTERDECGWIIKQDKEETYFKPKSKYEIVDINQHWLGYGTNSSGTKVAGMGQMYGTISHDANDNVEFSHITFELESEDAWWGGPKPEHGSYQDYDGCKMTEATLEVLLKEKD